MSMCVTEIGNLQNLLREHHQRYVALAPNLQGRDALGHAEFLGLALAGEAGELANKVKKVVRGDIPLNEQRPAILEEAVDCIFYSLIIIDTLQGNATIECERKMDVIKQRLRDRELNHNDSAVR